MSQKLAPAFPSNQELPQDWLNYLRQIQSSLFPPVLNLSASRMAQLLTGVTGDAIGSVIASGSLYILSVTVSPATVSTGGTMILPFVLTQNVVFTVAVDGVLLPAIGLAPVGVVPEPQSILKLPDWNSSNPVYIYGQAGA